jgi:2-amino-4-hydroxy-6-hydroxymethyldihydropteridine diphosphokinase
MDDVAYVALGSNVGDREANLRAASERIANIPGVTVIAATPVEETAPIGPVSQGAFLNQMMALRTSLAPRALLDALHAIEDEGGRERAVRWGPRTIDLDIVAFEQATVDDSDLVVPHPEIPNRDFWKRELALLRRGTERTR